MSRRRVAGLVVCAGALACADVPTLTFESDDAADDAGSDAFDEVANPAFDGASPEASCPDAVPPGASVCCGSIPCNGNCGAMCMVCASTCGTATLCCARTNSVACRVPTAPCN